MNDKEVLQLIKNRRSIRKFKNILIPTSNLLELVEAGIYAPSGSNSQCYRFIIIDKKEDMEFLGKTKLNWLTNVPNAILVYADLTTCKYLKNKRKDIFDKLPYQDCAMAMENILLLAKAKEIGACIIHLSENWKTANQIKQYFGLKSTDELMGIIALGYADEIVDYEKLTHANKPIKRKEIRRYINERTK
ncbi:MAG: nitroreductase family protein [Candidatus Omnitrophica bacterium]|jgi:nitroreductase|nr:nitroreductase family protein [Candidatus Omnitrophota bacterium]